MNPGDVVELHAMRVYTMYEKYPTGSSLSTETVIETNITEYCMDKVWVDRVSNKLLWVLLDKSQVYKCITSKNMVLLCF